MKKNHSTTYLGSIRAGSSPMFAPVRPNLVLGICCLSVLLIGMDITIVNVALPAIQRDLHATIAGLQWVVDAYLIVVASLLIFSGSASDRFGRKLVFQVGLALFSAGSLLASLTHTIGGLIVFRAVQGLGASMLNPVALSIIANVFPRPQDRTRALGVWGAVAGLSLALGPIVGGALTEFAGWRSIFWINIPICILAMAMVAKFVPESKAPRARAIDPVGQALVFVGLASLTYGIIAGPSSSWASPRIVGLFCLAGVALILFLIYEPKRIEPLIDLRFFRSVPFSSAALLASLSFGSFAGFLFLNALYLQQERGLSALKTGLCLLPLALAVMICSPLSATVVNRLGMRPVLMVAGLGMLLSSFMLVHLDLHMPILILMLAYALFGAGLGLVNPAITTSAVAGMPLSRSGVAAAIASASRQVGAALGVAICGTIVRAGRAAGSGFTQATHPAWWILASSGAVVFMLGWISTTEWAESSAGKVAHLFDEGGQTVREELSA
jgi:EmrB/QacA subfamily drug resistance transporter